MAKEISLTSIIFFISLVFAFLFGVNYSKNEDVRINNSIITSIQNVIDENSNDHLTKSVGEAIIFNLKEKEDIVVIYGKPLKEPLTYFDFNEIDLTPRDIY